MHSCAVVSIIIDTVSLACNQHVLCNKRNKTCCIWTSFSYYTSRSCSYDIV